MDLLIEILQNYSVQILLAVIAIILVVISIQISRIANQTKIIMINTKNQDVNFTKLTEQTDNINGILSQIRTQQGNNNDSWGVRPQ